MLTRRNFLTGVIATGVLARSRPSFAKASQPATPVNFDIPPHACDCHTHIYGDPGEFPLPSPPLYTPEATPPEEMSALHRARGIRIISGAAGPVDPPAARRRFQAAAERMKRLNWNIQMYTSLGVISAIKDLVQTSPVPVVFDHFGGTQAALGLQQPGFADLLDLVRSGKAYVKISGAYRASTQAPDYPDVVPFAKALIAANPDRIVWGTDWPHPNASAIRKPTDVLQLYQIDDGRLLNQLAVWAPDPAVRKKILVDNPARLYGF